MATILSCDGCTKTITSKDTRDWHCLRVSRDGVNSFYDLCPECFQRGLVAVRAGREKSLSPHEVAILQQIWGHAQQFDQSVIEPWHGKAGSA